MTLKVVLPKQLKKTKIVKLHGTDTCATLVPIRRYYQLIISEQKTSAHCEAR